jgi:hypothetical protein
VITKRVFKAYAIRSGKGRESVVMMEMLSSSRTNPNRLIRLYWHFYLVE